MIKKTDERYTVQVAEIISKTLHSRDAAERLERVAVSMWRSRPEARKNMENHRLDPKKTASKLVLDFAKIEIVSQSAAESLLKFQMDFSEDKNLTIEFSNLSPSVSQGFCGCR